MILFRQKSVGTESNDFCKDKYYSPNYRKRLLDYCYFPIIFTADIGNYITFFPTTESCWTRVGSDNYMIAIERKRVIFRNIEFDI